MQLMLDGAVTIAKDPLAMALNCAEISARILSWKNISIRDRYTIACQDSKLQPIDSVSVLLDEGQINRNFQLADQCISPTDIEPICSAMKLETPITLNLANNFLMDEGIQVIVNMDDALRDLRCLDLSGNFLTFSSLTFLRRIGRLEELKLNFNPIGDLGLLNLNFQNIKSLHLRNCELHNIKDLPLEGVTTLDLSFNKLGTSISKLRRKVIEIESLDLSFVIGTNWNEFFTGALPTLKELRLAGNALGDADVYQLLQICPNLTLLDVSHNPNLTSLTMEKLLHSSIKCLYANGCLELLDRVEEWECRTLKIPDFLQLTVNEAKRDSQISWLKTMCMEAHQQKGTFQVEQLRVTAFLLLGDNVQELSWNKV